MQKYIFSFYAIIPKIGDKYLFFPYFRLKKKKTKRHIFAMLI